MYVSVPPRFGVSAAAAGPARAATQSAVPRLAAANPDVLIICFLIFLPRFLFLAPFLLLGWILEPSSESGIRRNVRRSIVENAHSSTESNAPRCRPPSGRLAPRAAPDGPGCSFRPRSGSADETRSPTAD